MVALRSGLPSAYALEISLEPGLISRNADGVIRPSKWDKYADGSRTPQRMAGKTFAVDLAEARYPGTARYFDSPGWKILKGAKLDRQEIDLHLRALSARITDILLVADLRPDESERRFRDFDADVATDLVAEGSFDALTAVLLQIALSEAVTSPALRERALHCYRKLQPALAELPELAPFASEVFWAIDNSCKHWVFPTTQSRVDIVIFSRELPKRGGPQGEP